MSCNWHLLAGGQQTRKCLCQFPYFLEPLRLAGVEECSRVGKGTVVTGVANWTPGTCHHRKKKTWLMISERKETGPHTGSFLTRVFFAINQPPKRFPEMNYLTFLLAILHAHKALCQEGIWDTTIQLAENLTLECVYPSEDTLIQMEWFKFTATGKESIAIFNPAHPVIIRTLYNDRVYFLNSTLMVHDLTLSFYNASEADLGFYSCSLHTFPYGPWEKIIQVVSPDNFSLTVLPNTHIVSEPGKNVTLTCEFPREWPAEEVKWERLQPHQIDLLSSCNLSQGRSYPSKYHRNLKITCTQEGRSSLLVIPHAGPEDSGLYRCTFDNEESVSCVIDLSITLGAVTPGNSMGTAKADNQYILFLTGGTVLLLLFVILITTALVVSYNRRRRRRKGVFYEEPLDIQTKASNKNRNSSSTNQHPGEARDDIYVNYPTIPRRPRTKV